MAGVSRLGPSQVRSEPVKTKVSVKTQPVLGRSVESASPNRKSAVVRNVAEFVNNKKGLEDPPQPAPTKLQHAPTKLQKKLLKEVPSTKPSLSSRISKSLGAGYNKVKGITRQDVGKAGMAGLKFLGGVLKGIVNAPKAAYQECKTAKTITYLATLKNEELNDRGKAKVQEGKANSIAIKDCEEELEKVQVSLDSGVEDSDKLKLNAQKTQLKKKITKLKKKEASLVKDIKTLKKLSKMDKTQRTLFVTEANLNATKSVGNSLWAVGFIGGLAFPPLAAVAGLGGAIFLASTGIKAGVNVCRALYSKSKIMSKSKVLHKAIDTLNTCSEKLLSVSEKASVDVKNIIKQMIMEDKFDDEALMSDLNNITDDAKEDIIGLINNAKDALKEVGKEQDKFDADDEVKVAQAEVKEGTVGAIIDVVNGINWAFTFAAVGAGAGAETAGESFVSGAEGIDSLETQLDVEAHFESAMQQFDNFNFENGFESGGDQFMQYTLFAGEDKGVGAAKGKFLDAMQYTLFAGEDKGVDTAKGKFLDADGSQVLAGVIEEEGLDRSDVGSAPVKEDADGSNIPKTQAEGQTERLRVLNVLNKML